MPIKPLVAISSIHDRATRNRLTAHCQDVSDFGDALRDLATDLLDTMAHYRIAVGLAAPQIGVFQRVAVIDLKTKELGYPSVLVNPIIVSVDGPTDRRKESCMSVPHVRGPVTRKSAVTIQYIKT